MSLLCKRLLPRAHKNVRYTAARVDQKLYSPACPKSTAKPEDLRVAVEDARRFIIECLVKSKVPECNAVQQADLLVAADYRGHYSHGMNRLDMYINDLEKGSCCPTASPKIIKETVATAWVDGCNGLGAVSGNFCIKLAIEKAKDVGIGFVAAKNTNHYGIASWYTMQAKEQKMIGFSTTNTSPYLGPTRSKIAALGTNPISLAAPASGDGFILDMATSAVAVGKIEIARRKAQPIPHGWALGSDGKSTTDPVDALKAACVMPLGGEEMNSGYKGYGLAMLVEILGGILSGSKYARNIRKWALGGSTELADLGQSFMVIDPEVFAPGFEDRMADLIKSMRSLPTQDPNKPVLVAGDTEKMHMALVDKEGGVTYVEDQIKTCNKLSEKLKVKPLKQFPKKA